MTCSQMKHYSCEGNTAWEACSRERFQINGKGAIAFTKEKLGRAETAETAKTGLAQELAENPQTPKEMAYGRKGT